MIKLEYIAINEPFAGHLKIMMVNHVRYSGKFHVQEVLA